MKKTMLLFAVPVALLSLGLAQTPAPLAMSNTAASIKGCLGGSDGAYSVAQDGSTQTLKITSSSVDLKAHIGHQVELIGQKSSAAVFGAPDTISVTGVSMISEHCPMTAASTPTPADPTTATLSAPAATTVTASAAPPVAGAPAVSTPAAAPVASTQASTTPPEPVATATPEATASAPVVMASTKESLPNTAAPSLKVVKVTGNLGADGKTFVSDKDSKSWTVINPDFVKGHEGHHVTLTAHLDAVKSEVEIISLKMAK
jgi:hypothetical protein